MNELIEECRSCNSCLCWLKNCNAECCKGFFVNFKNIKNIKIGNELKLSVKLSDDLKNYYDIHGVKVTKTGVVFVIDDFFIMSRNKVFIIKKCKYLTGDNLCSVHNTDSQPNICKDLNCNNYKNVKGISITPNCLYKYKLEDESDEV